MADDSTLILVTGASGYIATHVVKLLLEEGYRVRGTVRSLQNEKKVKPLRDLCPDAKYKLELVEADLMNEECWGPALQDCTYVLHMASPFPIESPTNEDEVIQPAIQGTLAVLKACDPEQVKRVVITSSAVSVTSGADPADKVFTEEDWTDAATAVGAYTKSKPLAERAAWDFVEKLPDDKKFELVVLNPGLVLGPILCGGLTSSTEVIKRLLNHDVPGLPKIGFGTVDVRDVAQAHVNALTVPEAAGHRHILVTKSLSIKDMAVVLVKEFKSQGYSVPSMEIPNFLVKFASFFDKTAVTSVPLLGIIPKFDNSRMTNVLGIKPREMDSTILDTAYSIIERGLLKKTPGYTGPKL